MRRCVLYAGKYGIYDHRCPGQERRRNKQNRKGKIWLHPMLVGRKIEGNFNPFILKDWWWNQILSALLNEHWHLQKDSVKKLRRKHLWPIQPSEKSSLSRQKLAICLWYFEWRRSRPRVEQWCMYITLALSLRSKYVLDDHCLSMCKSWAIACTLTEIHVIIFNKNESRPWASR